MSKQTRHQRLQALKDSDGKVWLMHNPWRGSFEDDDSPCTVTLRNGGLKLTASIDYLEERIRKEGRKP